MKTTKTQTIIETTITPPEFAARMATQTGSHLHSVTRFAENYADSQQRARRSEIKEALERSASDEKLLLAEKKRVEGELDYLEPQRRVKKSRVGPAAALGVAGIVLGIVALAVLENLSGALVLLDTGAMGVDSLAKGMALLATPALVGYIFGKLAPYAMPRRWRRRWFWFALVSSFICFAIWAYCFALTGFEAISQIASLGDGGVEEVPTDSVASGGENTSHSWGLFGATVALMFLNPIVATSGLRAMVDSYWEFEPNPDYTRLLDELRIVESDLSELADERTKITSELACLDAERSLTVDQARATYLVTRTSPSPSEEVPTAAA